jgi:uncharacterized membrane protein YkvA (DUF1232 family)
MWIAATNLFATTRPVEPGGLSQHGVTVNGSDLLRSTIFFSPEVLMDGLFSTIRFFFGCGTLLLLALVVLAHLPKSPLRASLVQVCGWATALLCGAWCASPADPIPDLLFPIGFIDDVLVAIVGFKAAKAAWKAGKEKAGFKEEQTATVERRAA